MFYNIENYNLLCQKTVFTSNIVLQTSTKNYLPVIHFENGKFILYLLKFPILT